MDKIIYFRKVRLLVHLIFLSISFCFSITLNAFGQIVASGETLTIPAGSYETTLSGDSGHVLWALNGFSLNSLGPVILMSHGANAYGCKAELGGNINLLNGGSITTYFENPDEESSSHGILASANSSISLSNVTIYTEGKRTFGAYALAGGLIKLSGCSINNYGSSSVQPSAALYCEGTDSKIMTENTVVDATGAGTHAIYVKEGGNVSLLGGVISTEIVDGITAHGLVSTGMNSVISASNVSINSSGIGAYVENGGKIELAGNSIINSGTNFSGLEANGRNNLSLSSSVINADNLTIVSSGKDGNQGYGVYAYAGGEINLTNSARINSENSCLVAQGIDSKISTTNLTANSTGGKGVEAHEGSSINLLGQSTISTNSNQGIGVYAKGINSLTNDPTKVFIEKGIITTNGTQAHGIEAEEGGQVSMSEGIISSLGNYTCGFYSHGKHLSSNQSSIIHAANTFVNMEGLNSCGGYVQQGGELHLNGCNFLLKGTNSLGLYSNNGIISGLNCAISSSSQGAKILNGGSLNFINCHIQANSEGIILSNDFGNYSFNKVTFSGGSLKTVNQPAIYIQDAYADITISDGATISAGNGVILSAISQAIPSHVSFKANNVNLTGSIISDLNSQTTASLLNSSSLTGHMYQTNTVIDKTSTWYMNANSTIKSLHLVEGGAVIFTPHESAFKVLRTTGSLVGTGGTFIINTNLEKQKGDLIVFEGATQGSHLLGVNNKGGSPTGPGQSLKVIETGDGNALFNLAGETVDAGMFAYTLKRGNYQKSGLKKFAKRGSNIGGSSNHWYLVNEPFSDSEEELLLLKQNSNSDNEPQELVDVENSLGESENLLANDTSIDDVVTVASSIEPSSSFSSQESFNSSDSSSSTNYFSTDNLSRHSSKPFLSKMGKVIVSTVAILPQTWFEELRTLHRRMGQLRFCHSFEDEICNVDVSEYKGDFWINAYGSQIEAKVTHANWFDEYIYGTQLGFDKRFNIEQGVILGGIFGGWGETRRNFFEHSHSLTKSSHMGIYGTFITPSGFYADLILKGNYFDNKLCAEGPSWSETKGSYQNYALGGSLEVGKKYCQLGPWFFEPYGQIAYVNITGKKFKTNSGIHVSTNNSHSTQLRIGFLSGKDLSFFGNKAQIYVKGSFVKSFSNRQSFIADGCNFKAALDPLRGEIGAGIFAEVAKQCQIYADYECAKGSKYQQPWSINIGFRKYW